MKSILLLLMYIILLCNLLYNDNIYEITLILVFIFIFSFTLY